ncbi:glutaredoxin family protein [Shewanella waksmanii]|uniref:glutaredoxin family protein n=1 Tax=Shewanella waksmanii TaxID=213783 RepID=UPI003736C315
MSNTDNLTKPHPSVSVIKNIISYTLCLALGLALGYGALHGYKWLTTPTPVVVGDYSQHFEFSDKPVIMYGTDWCPVCANTRDYFAANNISYTEFNPEKDQQAQQRFTELSANAYPVIIIGNKRIIGLNIPEVELALKEHSLL